MHYHSLKHPSPFWLSNQVFLTSRTSFPNSLVAHHGIAVGSFICLCFNCSRCWTHVSWLAFVRTWLLLGCSVGRDCGMGLLRSYNTHHNVFARGVFLFCQSCSYLQRSGGSFAWRSSERFLSYGGASPIYVCQFLMCCALWHPCLPLRNENRILYLCQQQRYHMGGWTVYVLWTPLWSHPG